MQKLIFTLFAAILFSNYGISQAWNRHMAVKKMSIAVKTDAFTATTSIEIEFYNSNDTEIEGLYTFKLEPGQAITAFQLDLFGKFRDGSIEEKWKATNAYNTIVGKRVDPALLTLDYYNNYSVRIYPVPARGSRKITMTIQQLLVLEKETAVYKLPLAITDMIEELNVHIDIKNSSGFPSVIKGLLTDQVFMPQGSNYGLAWQEKKLKADKPLSFSIPLAVQQPVLCVKNAESKFFFALRLQPGISKNYTIQPQKIAVFWDASTSGSKRNITREISFLKQYVAANKISQLTIISFNQGIQDTAIFYTGNNFNSRWVDYLHSIQYEGATQFGVLDFSTISADAILLFSDGKNSFGRSLPVPGQTHVYCINSAAYPDPSHIEKIIGQTGGQYINLATTSFEQALAIAGKAENILLGIAAGNMKLPFDQSPQGLNEKTLFLTGSIPAEEKIITLSYGNNGKIREEEKITITADNICDGSAVDRIGMLTVFDSYLKGYYWMDVLNFGKREKVVTASTAFIVLEKIEDYVKFNITPPKELESQCDMNMFVKADEQRRLQYRQVGEDDIFSYVTQSYNERIAAWDIGQPLINFTRANAQERFEKDKQKTAASGGIADGIKSKGSGFAGMDDAVMETEVVVTALGQTRQSRELGYSVQKVTAAELTQSKVVNVQNALTGKISGLNVSTINSGVFGDTRITLRGIRSLTGNNQPMLVLDGVPVDLRFINSINPNSISDVTILKSAAATAIYGPDGANGALVIQTKKKSYGKYSYYWGTYKLKDQQDEDYLQEMKEAPYGEKISRYNDLKRTYGDAAAFYFDMAQHLYEAGFRKDALAVLYSAAEITGGDPQVLKAMGYTLESWKEFDEAIKVYLEMLFSDPKDLRTYRDLALAYYQHGEYQQAINSFYKGILTSQDNYEYVKRDIKSMMLQEMNAIISLHKDVLDISAINKQLIRPITVDLRIVWDCNTQGMYNAVSVVEPDGKRCYEWGAQTTKGKMSRFAYYEDHAREYQVKEAKEGIYKLRINYNDYYYKNNNALKIPTMIRITTFKNLGKPGQSLSVENVIMDNQNGDIEIGEVKW
ncbi:MAG TPA: VIT domain-containing protein [Chitinophagaceae bacterium]|jgi:TonB-dependent SusC/RagA subfamily outer membrane receptor|nr:VIT domain-containing protein [Chitinophagaceae bacterium]